MGNYLATVILIVTYHGYISTGDRYIAVIGATISLFLFCENQCKCNKKNEKKHG
jgi:hypothetical protein